MWSSEAEFSSISIRVRMSDVGPGLKIIAFGSLRADSVGLQMIRHLFSKYILRIIPIILLYLHDMCL